MESLFTRIVQRQLPAHIVAEDAAHLAFLDIAPAAWGHTLVIPKEQVDYLFDLSGAQLAALMAFARRVAHALQAVVPCKRVGLAVLGLEVPHVHLHLVPIQKESDLNVAAPRARAQQHKLAALATALAEALR